MTKRFVLAFFAVLTIFSTQVFATDIYDLIPSNANFVVLVNFKQFFANETVKDSVLGSLDENQKKEFDKFVADTGFNPIDSLSRVVIFSGEAPTTEKEKSAPASEISGAIFEGDFNREKLLKAIASDSKAMEEVKVLKIDGFDAIYPKKEDKETSGYGIFLSDSIAVLGSKAGVNIVKDVKLKKVSNISTRPEMSQVVAKLSPASTLSGAGLLSSELKKKIKENPQAAPLAAINTFYFSFDYTDAIKFVFNGVVDKEENVPAVATSLNGFLGMIKMFAAQVPEAAELLNAITVSTKGEVVRVAMNISKEKLEEARKKILSNMQEAGAGAGAGAGE